MIEPTVVKAEEIQALAKKLGEFSEGLSKNEQEIMTWILARARNSPGVELSEEELDAVAGGAGVNALGLARPVASQLAEAAGLTPGEQDQITVMWSLSC